MTEKLIDIATKKLLEKFGAGNHKPGSGSASAFQGMLAAQMLRTVIDLTLEPKRKTNYQKYVSRLQNIKQEIDNETYPKLETLFQLDSEQFDNVINLRTHRDNEVDWRKKRSLSLSATEALITSTKTPLDIAESCMELIRHAEYVFNHGWKAVRGDSAVAINCAISAVASCLSIVELNLISLPVDSRTEAIRNRKQKIKSDYLNLNKVVASSLNVLENESNQNRDFLTSILKFQNGNLEDVIATNSDIENLVRQLQNTLWLQKDVIWKNKSIKTPLDVLQPSMVLTKVMGYIYQSSNSLGIYEHDGELFEIAGLIDKNEKLVQVSKRFPQETQNFTAAHELGHAILHRQKVLHRDRPLDGSSNTPRSREEMQADKFATFFLMPTKMVKDIFFELFETEKFRINEASVLAIRGNNISLFRRQCRDKRGLARILATTEYYGGKTFNSLSKIFKVSTETMAIRLEELDLLDF
ncbi:MAG: cyclodeaminase/cyclohydrolase family protein [Chitinophagaceae bacterium]